MLASISVHFGANSVHACLPYPASHLINLWYLNWCKSRSLLVSSLRRQRLEALSHGLAGMQMSLADRDVNFYFKLSLPRVHNDSWESEDSGDSLPGLILSRVCTTDRKGWRCCYTQCCVFRVKPQR
ncbi:hypothetical protein NPIL_355161 [Nephila pilipes]|uniref:Uncharacterized protein n=1 Tax=Nephila pilipes TaxID=299642 RepID=A0A8X6NC72_NEPPI|nr:hypothetical protein NPIL_355161 [Nephila pilipes]